FWSTSPNLLASPPNTLTNLDALMGSTGGFIWDMDGNTASASHGSGADQDSNLPPPAPNPSPNGNWVCLNDRNHGSGQAHLRLPIPNSYFPGNQSRYIYLYTRFGDTKAMTGGYEEWYVGPAKNQQPSHIRTEIDQDIPGGEITNVSDVPLQSTVHDHAIVTDD